MRLVYFNFPIFPHTSNQFWFLSHNFPGTTFFFFSFQNLQRREKVIGEWLRSILHVRRTNTMSSFYLATKMRRRFRRRGVSASTLSDFLLPRRPPAITTFELAFPATSVLPVSLLFFVFHFFCFGFVWIIEHEFLIRTSSRA